MVVRYLVGLVLLAALVALATSVEAAYDEVEFTELLGGDGLDNTPYHDIESISIGEPGDGSFVLRVKIADMAFPSGAIGVHYWGFQAPAGDVFGGFTYDGEPRTRNIGEPIAPGSCVIDGGFGYCQWAYGDVGAEVGSTLSNVWGTTDGGVDGGGFLPFDVIPGVGIEAWPNWGSGASYTLTGSTAAANEEPEDEPAGNETGDDSESTGEDEPEYEVIEESIEGPTADIGIEVAEPSQDVYVYYWTNDNEAVTMTGDLVVEAGSIVVFAEDGDGTILFEEEFMGDVSLDEAFETVAAGEWAIGFDLYDFQGTAQLTYEPLEVEDDAVEGPTPEETEETTADNETADLGQAASTEESPGVGLAAIVVGVAAIALRRRR